MTNERTGQGGHHSGQQDQPKSKSHTSEARRAAGRLGGLAPHRCRGRECSEKKSGARGHHDGSTSNPASSY